MLLLATAHLFIDTNFFIQCKKYDQIDWNIDELENVGEIVIMIARPVLSEIDRHKQDGNTRRAKRARAANSLFRQMLANGKELVSEVGDKQVIFRFAQPYKIQDLKVAVPELDVDRNDDELVATAKMYQQQNPDIDVRVLTQDTGMVISADRCELPYIMTPDDWNLPPEKDDRDKKITELEDKVRTLSQQFPIIEISEPVLSEKSPVVLSELTDDIVGKLEDYIRQLYPLKSGSLGGGIVKKDLLSGVFGQFIPPTAEEISKYEERYKQWLVNYREWLTDVYDVICEREALYSVEFSLSNSGGAPVEYLHLEISTHGNIEMAPLSYTEEEEELALPEPLYPPSPSKGRPVWSLDQGLAGIQPSLVQPLSSPFSPIDYSFLRKPSSRDRNAFYWKGGKPDEFRTKWVFECEQFMHKAGSEDFLILVRGGDSGFRGAISVMITGANLPEPCKLMIPIRITPVTMNPYPLMLAAIQESYSAQSSKS